MDTRSVFACTVDSKNQVNKYNYYLLFILSCI